MGKKSFFLLAKSKVLLPTQRKTHLGTLFALFYGRALDELGQKCQFWAKFGCFLAKNPIFWGEGVKLLVPSYPGTNKTPFFELKALTIEAPIGAKSNFFLELRFLSTGHIISIPGAITFPVGTTPKKISVFDLLVSFRGKPQFLAVYYKHP